MSDESKIKEDIWGWVKSQAISLNVQKHVLLKEAFERSGSRAGLFDYTFKAGKAGAEVWFKEKKSRLTRQNAQEQV